MYMDRNFVTQYKKALVMRVFQEICRIIIGMLSTLPGLILISDELWPLYTWFSLLGSMIFVLQATLHFLCSFFFVVMQIVTAAISASVVKS